MSKKVICFIAQFPPPMHGLSKAVETLYESELKNRFRFTKINITNNKLFLWNWFKIAISRADLFYFTISQTKGGNLRDLMILRLLDLQKKKCVVHLHGGYYRIMVEKDIPVWQKKANYKAMSRIAGAIVLGESLKTIFEGMVEAQKIFVVKNCVDDAYLMEKERFLHKMDSIGSKRVQHILYLSNMIRTKGYLQVLEMAMLEKERCMSGEEKRFHFDFAGLFLEKEEEEVFCRKVRENQLEDYVTYHGSVSGDKKRKLLEESVYFVLLTRYPKEGQPISILEAMGNGMMIVTTDHAGIPDVVKPGENGVVATHDTSVDEIYSSLLQTDTEMLKEICMRNRNCIEQSFSEDRYKDDMRNIFESVE